MILPMGRPPSQGKMSRSKRPVILLVCSGFQPGARFAIHSRATASKLSAAAHFSALRARPGSMPAASCLRAASRRDRASFSPTVG